jgi:hypothetical protein
MISRIVLIVSGIIAIFVGLDYLLATESAILSFNLGDATMPARFFARTTGAAVLAIGVINILILAIGDTDSPALRVVVTGNIVVHTASLFGEFSESFERSPIFWVAVVIHVISIMAFGYLLATSGRTTT